MTCPPPDLCLICYDNLSSEELKSKTFADPEQIQGKFTNDAIFILRALFQVPEHLLEGFCVKVEDKIPPGLWISLCNRCSGAVAEAKLVYQQILELCAKFRDAREQMVQKVRESCGGGSGGNRGRSLRKKKGDDDFLKRFAITEECRKFVTERTFDPVNEEAFVVEDVAVWTKRFLARLNFQSAEIAQAVIIKPDNRENDEVDETLMTLDPLDFKQIEDTLTAMNDEDPLSGPEDDFGDDNPSSEETESSAIEFKPEVEEVKPKQTTDDLQEDDAKAISERLILEENECPTCHKQYLTVEGVKHHILVAHQGVRISKKPKVTRNCPEPDCNLTFSTLHDYRRHLITHREGEPKFKCDICGKAFHNLPALAAHRLRLHGIQTVTKRSFAECTICYSKHATAAALRRHIQIHHKDEVEAPEALKMVKEPTRPRIRQGGKVTSKSLQCHICGKTFRSSDKVREHVRFVHEGNYRLRCELCAKGLRHPYQLKLHMARSHPNPDSGSSGEIFQCPVTGCRRVFLGPQELNAHSAKEHGKSETRFQCVHCGKGFHQKYPLTQHEMTHTNAESRPVKCDLCGKGFANQHNMKIHKRTHSKEKVEKVKVEKRKRKRKKAVSSEEIPDMSVQ